MLSFNPRESVWKVKELRKVCLKLKIPCMSQNKKEDLCKALNAHIRANGVTVAVDAIVEVGICDKPGIVKALMRKSSSQRPQKRNAKEKSKPSSRKRTLNMASSACLIQCTVCTETIPPTELTKIGCGHIIEMCGDCAAKWIASERAHKRLGDIRCMMEDCRAPLTYDDMERHIPFHERQRAFALSMTEALGGFTCPTAGCGTPLCLDAGVQLSYALCEGCGRQICMHCRVEWHPELTCKEHQAHLEKISIQDEEKSETFKRDNYKECPNCHTWIEKFHGCDHMTCGNVTCRYQFCYQCSADYKAILRHGNAHHNESCQHHRRPTKSLLLADSANTIQEAMTLRRHYLHPRSRGVQPAPDEIDRIGADDENEAINDLSP